VAADEHDLDALRDLFQSEIRRIDQVLAEREKQVNLALTASEKAIDKADTEAERARQAANEWRGAMSDREKGFTPLTAHDLLQRQVNDVVTRQFEARGRQAAWVAAAGIIATLIAIGVGQIIRQGLTTADVSQQIQREAPWNNDKGPTERRISILEQQVKANQIQLNKLQQQVLLTTRR
jgi:hypothetical protein